MHRDQTSSHSSIGRPASARRRRLLVGALAVAGLVLLSASPAGARQQGPQAPASSHQSDGTAGTNGTASEPQPASGADFSGNGANTHGAYDSTRDGSPSQNGAGSGAATGKPCAGCVGAADNKNPPGQHPDGSDRNAGYECDRNQGIGQGNPAHTGCESTPAPGAAAGSTGGTAGSSTGPVSALCPSGLPMALDGSCVPTVAAEGTCPSGTAMSAGSVCVTAAVGGTCIEHTTFSLDGTCTADPTCPSGSPMTDGACTVVAAGAVRADLLTGDAGLVDDARSAVALVALAALGSSPDKPLAATVAAGDHVDDDRPLVVRVLAAAPAAVLGSLPVTGAAGMVLLLLVAAGLIIGGGLLTAAASRKRKLLI